MTFRGVAPTPGVLPHDDAACAGGGGVHLPGARHRAPPSGRPLLRPAGAPVGWGRMPILYLYDWGLLMTVDAASPKSALGTSAQLGNPNPNLSLYPNPNPNLSLGLTVALTLTLNPNPEP